MNYNTDDCLYPSTLKIASLYAEKYPDVDVFYSRCLISNEPDHTVVTGMHDWPEFSHEILLKACICGPFPLVKKGFLTRIRFCMKTDYKVSGDYATWLKMSKDGRKFMKVPEVFGCYYHNPVGISTDPEGFENHLKEDIFLREKYA